MPGRRGLALMWRGTEFTHIKVVLCDSTFKISGFRTFLPPDAKVEYRDYDSLERKHRRIAVRTQRDHSEVDNGLYQNPRVGASLDVGLFYCIRHATGNRMVAKCMDLY